MMIIVLENEDVKKIIADKYGVEESDIEVDEDNLFSINITTCSAFDIHISKTNSV